MVLGMQIDLFFLVAGSPGLLALADTRIGLSHIDLITDTFTVVSGVAHSLLIPSLTYSGCPYVCPCNDTSASLQNIPLNGSERVPYWSTSQWASPPGLFFHCKASHRIIRVGGLLKCTQGILPPGERERENYFDNSGS